MRKNKYILCKNVFQNLSKFDVVELKMSLTDSNGETISFKFDCESEVNSNADFDILHAFLVDLSESTYLQDIKEENSSPENRIWFNDDEDEDDDYDYDDDEYYDDDEDEDDY